jgi:hypothetical protein
VPENHLTPSRAMEIVEQQKIAIHELEHVRGCATCNGWLRAIAAMQSALGTKPAFEIPPAPDRD